MKPKGHTQATIRRRDITITKRKKTENDKQNKTLHRQLKNKQRTPH